MHAAMRILDIASFTKARRLLCAVALIGFAAGCATVPHQQMSDARQAIDSADPVADDEPMARNLLAESRDHLDAAERYLEAGDYELARDHAEMARRLAIQARETAENADDD